MALDLRIPAPSLYVRNGTAGPQLKVSDGTTIPLFHWGFDATTEEALFGEFLAHGYTSGNVTFELFWYADSASSGGVTFGVSLAAITANTDTQDVETDGLATEVTGSDTHLGTTGQREHSFTIAVNQLDSLADGDHVRFKVARKPSDASDTMTGDCELMAVRITAS